MSVPNSRFPSTLALCDAFAGVASGARSIVTFERMGISLLEDADTVKVHLLTGDGSDQFSEHVLARTHYSDRLWPPVGGPPVCIGDSASELDLSYPIDRRIVDAGRRSVLAISLETQRRQLGVLWFDSHRTEAFEPGDAAALGHLADLLAAAVAHDRLWTLEQARRIKRDKLEALLPTIASALDVRTVLSQLSDPIQGVIPHVTFSLALLTPDRLGVKVHVASNYDVGDLPEYRFTAENETISTRWRSLVAHDCAVVEEGVVRARISPADIAEPAFIELRPGAVWTRIFARLNLRSIISVPIRIRDEAIGGVSFGSDRTFAYSDDDVLMANRIAGHVALALAHERLAEEGRRTAQAQEREARLQERVEALVQELEGRGSQRALGNSARWKDALVQATRAADTDTTVLVTGESGTGKEVVARYIHRGSRRARGPFVALNCAALPEQLLESELFGYERGAFTGAHVAQSGRLEQAAGGVLFLDEVSEMTPAVQTKFLRVLQEREFQRLGGSRTLKADIRVIAATHRNPREAMEQGTLREDLYYRLSAFEIALPPLRERPEDVVPLADAFVAEVGRSIGRPAAGISEDAREQLLAHAWPGNVRELRNAIERAVILCQGGVITSEHLPIGVASPVRRPAASATTSLEMLPESGLTLEAVERSLLVKALAQARNNKSRAAKLLGLPRGQLYSLLRRHRLTDARR
jgi:transcriptional regulator with GAF, ATPase, and Fis domain